MSDLAELRRQAREIFAAALRSTDAREAVQRVVRLEKSLLTIGNSKIDRSNSRAAIYAVAIGKAAMSMAVGLDEALGGQIEGGFIIGQLSNQRLFGHLFSPPRKLRTPWCFCEGGHPLPNKGSLVAAESVLKLMKRAEEERALVIFLISGGGSAMIEWPSDPSITLADLRMANRLLVSCGASIGEINSVRCAFSAIKGGGLAACAPHANQITLIISDTNMGDEASVASGPTIAPPSDVPDAREVVARYDKLAKLPRSILNAINQRSGQSAQPSFEGSTGKHHVLLDNSTALEAASESARQLGHYSEIAADIVEQRIDEGVDQLLLRLKALRARAHDNQPVCLLSGGEFRCPVRGKGRGGRNSETALRLAIELSRFPAEGKDIVALSAGTDGVDGNSPAAGAIADQDTIERAVTLGLKASAFLEESNSFGFFDKLSDTIVTGVTGTNVRDVRILLAN